MSGKSKYFRVELTFSSRGFLYTTECKKLWFHIFFPLICNPSHGSNLSGMKAEERKSLLKNERKKISGSKFVIIYIEIRENQYHFQHGSRHLPGD